MNLLNYMNSEKSLTIQKNIWFLLNFLNIQGLPRSFREYENCFIKMIIYNHFYNESVKLHGF